MNDELREALDYHRTRMRRFKAISDTLGKNFDNEEFQWMFAFTESEKKNIEVLGCTDDAFVVNFAIGTLAHILNTKDPRFDALDVFEHLFDELDEDTILAAHYAIHGKLPR